MIHKNLRTGFFLFLVMLTIGCNQKKTEQSKGFSITGNIANIPDGTIYLMKAGDYLGYTFEKIDSAKIINGRFNLQGSIDFPEMYYLITKDNQSISFFNENSEINIEGDITNSKNVMISGSTTHTELMRIQEQIDSLQSDTDKSEYIKSFMTKNKKSFLNPYLVLTYIFNLATYEELKVSYYLMDSSLKQHRYTKRIKNQLDVLKAIQIGQIAPDFIEKDTVGNDVSLSSFRGSYVLIDFWASWCGPCRKENPDMVELYNELKAKNLDFEIIGVAGDFVEDRWKKAIIKDGLPWVNISDIKGFDGTVLKMYGIKSLPYTVLLDKEGKIIEKGLTGEELRIKIREIILPK
ncbi:MAG: AhpC/TSA family protein [Maribacter sp.]|nr:AhpC/TSA family protein [Maribacter sp.]